MGSRILARDVLAVAEGDRPQLRRLAGKLGALETERHALAKGAGGDGAHPVLPGLAARLSAWAGSLCHPGALLAGDPANSDLHELILSELKVCPA